MSFIHQDKIVPFKCVDGDGLVAHLILQFVDVENLNCMTREQVASILVEEFGLDSSGLKLAQVLLAQSFVWGEQDNAIQLAPATVLF